MTVLVKVENLVKKYDEKVILDGISFEVSEGESLAIVGFSGSGKSTVLRLISGLEPYQDGTIQVNDPNLSMVFQYSALFDSLTIFENVSFVLTEGPGKKENYSKDQLRTMVKEKLQMVGLTEIEDVLPGALSGGMQKRVSFARAIVNNPKIILYDEPTSGLDPVASTVIEDYINRLKKELNAASIVVTHQMSTITRTADKLIMLYGGKIVWAGTPEEMLNTDDPYAVQFVNADRKGPMKTVAG
jgi:phospholipid/cholesterol/gamma-HCH transport system ATP-binding protein